MKALLISLLALGSISSFAAVNLSCKHTDPWGNYGATSDEHLMVVGNTLLDCSDKNDVKYTVALVGVGPGMRYTSNGIIGLTCPTVSKAKLNNKGRINLGAVRVAASVVGGGNVAVALNHRGGVCLMGGLEFGAGFSVVVGKMSILKGESHTYNDLLIDMD